VFREFLAQLDRLQPKPPARPVRGKQHPRKRVRRGR
jgi:hypothetical protein